MIKRQQRLQRIADVLEEYRAAGTAAAWLAEQMAADPSLGRQHGWEPKGGQWFVENLDATYVVKMYAEFEAGIRDYWRDYLGRQTRPPMATLIRHAIPTQAFSQDCIDNADDVRVYRNYLVHSEAEQGYTQSEFTPAEVKRHLCEYFGRLDPRWR